MEDLKLQGTKAFFWDFFGKMTMHATGFIVTILLARLLEPADFGLIAMVMVVVGVAQVFTDIGLGSALIQRRRILPVHYSSVFFLNIFIGAFLTLITFLSASWIGAFYNSEQLVPIVQIMSSAFLINAFSSVQAIRLRKKINYAALAKANVTASLLSGITGVLLAYNGLGVWSLVVQVLLRSLVFTIYLWCTTHWLPSVKFSLKALMQLWSFGFRMFICGLLDTLFNRLDILIIGKLFTPATLGFFERSKYMDQIVVAYSSGSLMSVLFPILSKVQNDLPRFQHIILKSLGIISFVVFMLLGVMYLISEEMIIILFTEKWLYSAGYFKILILSGFSYPISALLVNVLSSRGNSKSFLRLEIYKKIILGINLSFIFIWGIEGYLYGLVIASIVVVFLNIVFASEEIKIPKSAFIVPIIVQMFIALVAATSVVQLIVKLECSYFIILLLKIVFFVSIYVTLNIFFKTTSYEDCVEQILPGLKKIIREFIK